MDHLLFFATAFSLGAAHALEPGHGKTLVAAYLSGSSGKISDAFLLGILVTIFHTLSVFIIGLAGALIFGTFFKLEGGYFRFMEVFSGLIIVGIGVMIFWRRFITDKTPDHCECHITHHHKALAIPDSIHPEQSLPPAMKIEGDISIPGEDVHEKLERPVSNLYEVISLGVASGLSPCPIAVAALVASITLGGYGKLPETLFYLLIFSLGLGSVLVVIGIIFILSRNASRVFISKSSKLPVYFSRFSTLLLLGLGFYLIVHGLFGPIETLKDVSGKVFFIPQ